MAQPALRLGACEINEQVAVGQLKDFLTCVKPGQQQRRDLFFALNAHHEAIVAAQKLKISDAQAAERAPGDALQVPLQRTQVRQAGKRVGQGEHTVLPFHPFTLVKNDRHETH